MEAHTCPPPEEPLPSALAVAPHPWSGVRTGDENIRIEGPLPPEEPSRLQRGLGLTCATWIGRVDPQGMDPGDPQEMVLPGMAPQGDPPEMDLLEAHLGTWPKGDPPEMDHQGIFHPEMDLLPEAPQEIAYLPEAPQGMALLVAV